MGTKRIVYTRPDGGVSVVGVSPEYLARFPTEADALAALRPIVVPPGATNVTEVGLTALPSTRRFRNAWRQVGAVAPQVDMPLARIQRMGEVRVERAPKLTKSDVEFLRAQETGNTTLQASLKDYRQRLRDLPATERPTVDAIATPETLAAWNPAWPIDPA